MDEAICEPKFRRGCLCQRENIIIGNHLWSRLPAHDETKCYQTCTTNGLEPRVIEWNPFFEPENRKFEHYYRKTPYQYLYDGKFCHCIKSQYDMHQYRPCTDELCRLFCGHYEATCDQRTRRACFCKTHQLSNALGRRPDPGELNCDIACRYGLFDAKILDVKWEIPVESWGVKISKYCACVQHLTPAGISHCDPFNDDCPQYCGVPTAYCTREKYCHCGIVKDLLANNSMIRLGNGKEQDECGEKCQSWLWPMAEDLDNRPYIYDEQLGTCSEQNSCPKIDTSPWKQPNVSEQLNVQTDSLDSLAVEGGQVFRRFCLCAKTGLVMHKPGNRFIAHIEPERVPTGAPCPMQHTCEVVGDGIHIVG